jgi:hypothetical protein
MLFKKKKKIFGVRLDTYPYELWGLNPRPSPSKIDMNEGNDVNKTKCG